MSVITEPAVVLAGETARVVDVLFAASAAVERRRMLMIKSTGIKEKSEGPPENVLPGCGTVDHSHGVTSLKSVEKTGLVMRTISPVANEEDCLRTNGFMD